MDVVGLFVGGLAALATGGLAERSSRRISSIPPATQRLNPGVTLSDYRQRMHRFAIAMLAAGVLLFVGMVVAAVARLLA